MWAAVWLPARRRLGRGGPVALQLRTGRMTVRDTTDLATVGEVLRDELYDVPGLDDVHEIVDLGSHIGTAITYFRHRYPAARIHGLEPDPGTFAALQANAGGLEGVTLDRRAISGSTGRSTFFCSENSLASSLVARRGSPVTVATVSLDELMGELGLERIDLLKLDVEGAEYDVLASCTRLEDVRAIAGELHPGLVSRTPEEFFALLDGFEISVDRFSDASWQFQARRA